jgi:hypothetical protein
MLWWLLPPWRRYPTSAAQAKQPAGRSRWRGRWIAVFYRKARRRTRDVSTGVLIAKTIVDAAVWDTVPAGACQRRNDTTCLRQLRTPFIAKVDPARQYLTSGYASPDSGLRLAAAVVGLSGGSKLAQAGAYDPAYTWLDQLLNALNSRASADTAGPRHAIRRQGSFWFGLSSALSLGVPYQAMVDAKSCDQAKDISDRIQRSPGDGLAAPSPRRRDRMPASSCNANQMPQ